MQYTINRKWALTFGVPLALPTAYFISISLLKYGMGVPFLYDSAQPLLDKFGIKESLGWNINLLILFGPLIALALNLFSVLRIEWQNERENFSIKLSIQKHWWNMMLVIFSGLLLAILFIYAIGENCGC
ncbi:MAG TPA: hypothetical protein VGP43_04290 [Chitinophagaceae bacterium]|nr:hypothetical protein [Chitinophagaceae bacterium]